MSTIEKTHLVEKRNILNELRANNMTLQELRFFSIYLSKINPNDVSTRVVRFSIKDFKSIMELGKININHMKAVTNSLLSKVINIPNERGGYVGFQLFKRCKVDFEDDDWYIEFDAHDDALPLMFEFKNKYFTYRLWNALRLKSVNQLRMYEILKQYEKIGIRILSIEELRNLLGIDKKEYKEYKNFRIRVLDACQHALAENTDIKFTYEPYGRKGRGGKILNIKFKIEHNKNHQSPLSLEEFIDLNNFELTDQNIELIKQRSRFLVFLNRACNNEFLFTEIGTIYDLIIKTQPNLKQSEEIYNYLLRKYNELNYRDSCSKIKYRFAYLKKLIEADISY